MPAPSGEQCCFDGVLYLMSMMHVAGVFRIIDSGDGAAAHDEAR
jgi:oligosaccharide reducing-end xylanase